MRVRDTGVSRSSRGMRWVNFWAPNNGLRGVPVGTPSANVLGANGLKPFLQSSNPLVVKMPHLNRSRRVIWS